jgi:hypothetical protein
MGFHEVPWGIPLTLVRALGLTGLDLHLLNRYLLDFPFPVLLLLAAGYLIGRRSLGVRDAVPLIGAAALTGLLFFYWHRDLFYGPRFLFSVVPWILISVARSIVLLCRAPADAPQRARLAPVAVTLVTTAVVVGAVMLTPARLETYRDSTPVLDLHPDRDAREAGLRNAVVVIPDGWGSRLIARMWAAGVPVRRSTRLYGAIDACTLQMTLDAAAQESLAGEPLATKLDSLAALARPGVRADLTEDPNLRLQPGVSLADACRDEIAFDRRGFISFAPFLYLNNATLDGDVVWARDMRDGNAVMRRRYPARAFYRYGPDQPGGSPRLVPLRRAER